MKLEDYLKNKFNFSKINKIKDDKSILYWKKYIKVAKKIGSMNLLKMIFPEFNFPISHITKKKRLI